MYFNILSFTRNFLFSSCLKVEIFKEALFKFHGCRISLPFRKPILMRFNRYTITMIIFYASSCGSKASWTIHVTTIECICLGRQLLVIVLRIFFLWFLEFGQYIAGQPRSLLQCTFSCINTFSSESDQPCIITYPNNLKIPHCIVAGSNFSCASVSRLFNNVSALFGLWYP